MPRNNVPVPPRKPRKAVGGYNTPTSRVTSGSGSGAGRGVPNVPGGKRLMESNLSRRPRKK